MKQALIVIDVQESFRHRPFWDASEYPAFVSQIQSLIDGAAAQDMPVLQVFHISPSDDPANPFSLASGHVRTLKELRISPSAVFHKTVHSALYAKDDAGASLHDWLVKHGIEGVIVAGIRTEQCCETTSRNFSVKRCDKLGAPRLVLFVKKPTLIVFASTGIVAPLKDTCGLQEAIKNPAIRTKLYFKKCFKRKV